jgi:hypothetical protein
MVLFKGNEHYPLGNANISIVNGKLSISNLGSSGLDGVLIKAPANNVDIRYTPFNITGNKVFRICTKGLQANGTINTLSEKVYWRDSSNILQIGFNMSLVPPNYDVVGYTNGLEVFRIPFNNRHYNPVPNPNPDPDPNPEPQGLIFAIIGAVAALVGVAKVIYDVYSDKYTETTVDDTEEGKKTTITRVYTDPPLETYIIDGNNYDCEVIGIEYNEVQQISSPKATYTNLIFEITTANLNSFEIQDEVS